MPDRPEHLDGWKEKDFDHIHEVGDVLLGSGESSDNGRIGVTVIEIQAPKPCTDNLFLMTPRAKLRFYRVSDGSALYEDVFQTGGINMESLRPGFFSVSGVSVINLQINSKEAWVRVECRR